jgi:isopropylmalate/homocitrate/citramalate synthase
MKDEEIYNIFDTASILQRPASVAISSTSGAAGIAYWINDFYNLPDGKKVAKQDPAVLKVKEWVDNEYNGGRETMISDEELEALTKEFAAGV